MKLFEDTPPKSLKQLLGESDAGEAALPDFQRDFVLEPHTTGRTERLYRLKLSGREPAPYPEYPPALCLSGV